MYLCFTQELKVQIKNGAIAVFMHEQVLPINTRLLSQLESSNLKKFMAVSAVELLQCKARTLNPTTHKLNSCNER